MDGDRGCRPRRAPASTLQSPTVTAALPAWLAQYGYNFELLKAGHNEIPVQVWLATRGTNTVEGVAGRPASTRSPTTDDHGRRQHVRSARRRSSTRSRPWRRRRGHAAAGRSSSARPGCGSLPPLPIGPGGRMQQPRGSLVISATLGAGITFALDCVPGTVHRRRRRAGRKPRRRRSPRWTHPRMSCLSALPTSGVRLEMADERRPRAAYARPTYSYAPAVSYRLPDAYLRSLFDAGPIGRGRQRAVVELHLGRGRRRLARGARRAGPRAGHRARRSGRGDRSECRRDGAARSSSPTIWPAPRG